MLNIQTIAKSAMVASFLIGSTVIGHAQESSNRVDAKTDWSVFVEEKPEKQCWIVSAPGKSVATRGGKVVSVKRSDIRLFVTHWPAKNVNGEVSFTGGYSFKKDSSVKLQIGSSSYNLFVDGEFAWAASVAEDSKITTSMRRGATAVLTGESARGTVTKDTFSLKGFTDAAAEAAKRCG